MNFENFEASHHWLCNFKPRYSLVSRRISDIVTRHEIRNYETIEKSEKDFLNDFHEMAPNYLPSEILTTDQVGIQKEIHSSRTISIQGRKRIYGAVVSKNAATHSYTIQLTISLDGKLIEPMYLCLQDTNGKMGGSSEMSSTRKLQIWSSVAHSHYMIFFKRMKSLGLSFP